MSEKTLPDIPFGNNQSPKYDKEDFRNRVKAQIEHGISQENIILDSDILKESYFYEELESHIEPLNWGGDKGGLAKTPFGPYELDPHWTGESEAYFDPHFHDGNLMNEEARLGTFPSSEAAKDACWEHHVRMVKSLFKGETK